MVKTFGNHNKKYPIPFYNEACYKENTLYEAS